MERVQPPAKAESHTEDNTQKVIQFTKVQLDNLKNGDRLAQLNRQLQAIHKGLEAKSLEDGLTHMKQKGNSGVLVDPEILKEKEVIFVFYQGDFFGVIAGTDMLRPVEGKSSISQNDIKAFFATKNAEWYDFQY